MDIVEKILTKLFIDNLYIHYFFRCHNMPNRSFFIKGRQFHICARCTGIFFGIIFFPLLILFPVKIISIYIIFATSFITIDGLTQFFKLRESNNFLRLITGILFGIAVPNAIIIFFKIILHKLHALE